jgi:hypoxanthine phosphoribosyltransferase
VTPLFEAEVIQQRVRELGAKISEDYADRELVVVGVLTGCFVFMADLVRTITRPLECEFLGLSSYGSATESSGVVAITKDLTVSIEGKHLLVVEDIVDSGLTMAYLLENLGTRRPASVRVVSLLSKPARRRVNVSIDYLGFTIEDRFVVGYGMDHGGRYRNLPYLAALD